MRTKRVTTTPDAARRRPGRPKLPTTELRERCAMLEAEGAALRQQLANVERERQRQVEKAQRLESEIDTCTAERRAIVLALDHLVRQATRETSDARSTGKGAHHA